MTQRTDVSQVGRILFVWKLPFFKSHSTPDRSYFSIQIDGSPGYSVGDAGLTLFISYQDIFGLCRPIVFTAITSFSI